MIHLHIGGAGVMIGDMLWQLYEKESVDMDHKKQIYFESQRGYHPRAVFADLDDRMISQIKLKYNDSIITASAKEDGANNYSCGHYTLGKYLNETVLRQIRKLVEGSDKLNEFIFTSSISGGTGSGFTSLLAYTLENEFPKIKKQLFYIFPSPEMNNNIVYPYNTMLAFHQYIQYFNAQVLFDNQGMYQMLENNIDIDHLDYQHINNLVAQTISSYTSIPRFQNKSNSEIFTSIIPYQRLQILTPSHGPLICVNDYKRKLFSPQTIQKYIFSPQAQLYSTKTHPNYIATSIIQRGLLEDLSIKLNVNSLNINHFYKQNSNFFLANSKNYQTLDELTALPITNTLFSNDCNITIKLNHLAQQYDIMYSQRSHVHWFVGEGLESGELSECREDMASLIKDYEEVKESVNSERSHHEEADF